MDAMAVLNFAALAALMPATVAGLTGSLNDGGVRFWALTAVAVAGPIVWTVSAGGDGWRADLAYALWVSVSASLAVYCVSAAFEARVARLGPVFFPLMLVTALLAWLGGFAQGTTTGVETGRWFWVHVSVSVLTYAFLAIAASGALAALIQNRALKKKTPLKRMAGIPSVLDCEHVVVRFLWLSVAVLVLGMMTGTAINLAHERAALEFDHKTVFAIAALAVLLGLVYAHRTSGSRGRAVARFVLLAYFLVTLAYPGVKFVTDVVLTG